MKKFNLLALLSVIFVSVVANGQNGLSPLDRLNGIVMEKQLFIRYDESTNAFLYFKDEHPGTLLQISPNDLFTLKGTDDGKYTLAIEFYNPLRVKFSFDEKRVADPAIEAINSFISKFPSEFVQFNMTEVEKQVEIRLPDEEQKFKESGLFRVYTFSADDKPIDAEIEKRVINVTDYLSSYLLSQWVYELNSALDGKIEKQDSLGFTALFKEISQIKDAENYLYGKIQIGEESKTLNDWVLDMQKKIYEVTSAGDFISQLNDSKGLYGKLLQSQQKAEKALNNFFSLITTKYDEKIAPLFRKQGSEVSKSFKEYCVATVSLVKVLIDDRKRSKDEALTKFKEFNEALQRFYNQFQQITTPSGRTAFSKVLQTSQIRHDEGIIKNIFVSATKLDDNGKEHTDQAKSINFNISRWNSMYPVVSAGSLFTNVAFPAYSVDSSNSLVDVKRKSIRATPAVFLNFYTGILKNDYLYLFLQFGVAPINDNGSIMVPVGAGLSIGGKGTLANRITFSGGFLPAFVKELNNLKIGDKIKDNSVLQNDLTYKLFTSGYFSVNFNLFK